MDRDKDNVLSQKELEDGLKTLGLELTSQEVANAFVELDKDGSQTLDLQEFFVAVRVGQKKRDVICNTAASQ